MREMHGQFRAGSAAAGLCGGPAWIQHMLRAVTKTIAGWGNFPLERCCVYRPEKRSEVAALLAAEHPPTTIARGLGRSYGDAALNRDHGVMIQSQLNRFLSFDEAEGVLECEAGTSLAEIIAVLLPRGFFPQVVPGTQFITVGGAIAADVHGKNHHRDGSFAGCVVDLTLLMPSGVVWTCSPHQRADVYWATIGGMGLTGVIQTARIRLQRVESAYLDVAYRRFEHVDPLLNHFDEHDPDHHYSVAWIDCLAKGRALGRGVLMLAEHAARADLPPRTRARPLSPPRRRTHTLPCFAPAALLNPLTVRAFNALYYHCHRSERKLVDYDRFFFPLDRIHHWNRIYGQRGFTQYQAVLPPSADAGHRGVKAMLQRIADFGGASFLAVLKKFGPASPGLLSFPMEGYTLSLDLPNTGPKLLDLMGALDRIVIEHGGRVYLAKDACLSRASFAAMYPNLERFKQIKVQLDPERRLASSQARRLGIVEGG